MCCFFVLPRFDDLCSIVLHPLECLAQLHSLTLLNCGACILFKWRRFKLPACWLPGTVGSHHSIAALQFLGTAYLCLKSHSQWGTTLFNRDKQTNHAKMTMFLQIFQQPFLRSNKTIQLTWWKVLSEADLRNAVGFWPFSYKIMSQISFCWEGGVCLSVEAGWGCQAHSLQPLIASPPAQPKISNEISEEK